MRMDLGGLQSFGAQQQPQAQARPQGRVASGSTVDAKLASMAAVIRKQQAQIEQLTKALGALHENDKKTADYVNKVAVTAQRADQNTQNMIKQLRAFSRGGGVRPGAFTPKTSDPVIAYDTPPAGQTRASQANGNDEPVDPGDSNGQPTISYEDALFHGMVDNDD